MPARGAVCDYSHHCKPKYILMTMGSHHVHDRAACPRSLYYIRYYTGAAISTSKPTEAPIPRRNVCRTWDTR